jgi:hypothetical protein
MLSGVQIIVQICCICGNYRSTLELFATAMSLIAVRDRLQRFCNLVKGENRECPIGKAVMCLDNRGCA